MATETSLFEQFSELIGQPVRVQLQDGTCTDGVLYCIDPETDHVALLCPSGHGDSDYSVKIVMAHHVLGVEEKESTNIPTLAELQEKLLRNGGNGLCSQEDEAATKRRREQLEQFLKKHFVPFDVMADGSIRVFGGAATVREPFRAVECANEQLLRRMQQLLAQFDQQKGAYVK